MPAPGRQPVGEADEDDAARPGHPHHLGQHRLPVRDVLQHVGGEAHVHRSGGERQPQRAADRAARPGPAQAGQLAAVGVQAHRTGPGRAELPREVAWPATDIRHHPSVQVGVPADLADGVTGQARVVPRRVRLLGAERPEQPDRPGHVRAEGGTIMHKLSL